MVGEGWGIKKKMMETTDDRVYSITNTGTENH